MSEAGTGAPPPELVRPLGRSLPAAPTAVDIDPPQKESALKRAGASLSLALRIAFWTVTLGLVCAALEGLAAGVQSSASESIKEVLRSVPRIASVAALLVYWVGQQLLCFVTLGLAALVIDLPAAAGACAGGFAGLLPVFLVSMQQAMGDPDPENAGSRTVLLILLVNAAASAVVGGLAFHLARKFVSSKQR